MKVFTWNKVNDFSKRALDVGNKWVNQAQHCELIFNLKRYILYIWVRHSQKMRETPLTPWIIVEQSGNILAAHCNCMAGLGKFIFSNI